MITQAVLLLVGVVGMTGTIDVAKGIVVRRVLVGIAHLEADGGTCGHTFEHTRQHLYLVSEP